MDKQEKIFLQHLEKENKELKEIISNILALIHNSDKYEQSNGRVIAVQDAMVKYIRLREMLDSGNYIYFIKDAFMNGFDSGYFAIENVEPFLESKERYFEEYKNGIVREEWKRENENDKS